MSQQKKDKMKIQAISGRAFCLPGDDIDTDRIIPARFLRCTTFDGLGEHVFEDDRKQLDGKHPFDNPNNKGCEILVAGANFGCGSSREHAVAAIQRWGIKAIVASSFAAIFRGNATANGLVCVDVCPAFHDQILDVLKNPGNRLIVDIEHMVVKCLPSVGAEILLSPFELKMPSADRDMLTTGKWDTTTTLLEVIDQIEATERGLPYLRVA